jgi:hypothetical protein
MKCNKKEAVDGFPVIKGAELFYFKGNKVGILISHSFSGERLAQNIEILMQPYQFQHIST